jgi:hypothetical protein
VKVVFIINIKSYFNITEFFLSFFFLGEKKSNSRTGLMAKSEKGKKK